MTFYDLYLEAALWIKEIRDNPQVTSTSANTAGESNPGKWTTNNAISLTLISHQGYKIVFCSSQQLLVSVLDPWGAFKADMALFNGPQYPAWCVGVLPAEMQGRR